MLHVTDAPDQARRLCKQTGFLRKSLTTASKAEEAGTPGAREERERLTSGFYKAHTAVERAITDTNTHADCMDLLSRSLKHPADDMPPEARAMHLLGADTAPLVDLATNTATRARDAASAAQDRLDAHYDDLKHAATTALFLSKLPSVNFVRTHPSLDALRRDLHSYRNKAKKA